MCSVLWNTFGREKYCREWEEAGRPTVYRTCTPSNFASELFQACVMGQALILCPYSPWRVAICGKSRVLYHLRYLLSWISEEKQP
jgi:hypothetical protein